MGEISPNLVTLFVSSKIDVKLKPKRTKIGIEANLIGIF
jgi:hypothetical protein